MPRHPADPVALTQLRHREQLSLGIQHEPHPLSHLRRFAPGHPSPPHPILCETVNHVPGQICKPCTRSVPYASLARDFSGIRDTAEAEKQISELEKEGRIGQLLAAEVKRNAAERVAIERLTAKLDTIGSGDEPPALPRLLRDLEIAGWKKKADSADREEALSARRVLEWLYVRASSFLPQDLLARKDFQRALLALTVATEIKPESPQAWYNRACGQARAGQRKKALEDLRVALRNGFSDRQLIQSDPDLASLRDDEEFRRIVSLIR
jgi:tetratricopeptide (TPR) repeat protein